MANKLGIQCQERNEEVYRYNRELLPVVVKSINILNPGHYARLAIENPGVELVYRQAPNGSWENEGDGRRWAEHLHRLVGHISQITLVEGHNEWIHSPPHNTPEDYEKADRFMVELIDRVHELWSGRVHAVVLNASCGHFNEDIVDFFPRTLAKLQACGKCLLALHEYDHPSKDMLGDGGHNLCGKFLRNLAGLKEAGYDKVRIAITECGVDSGVGVPAGSGHVGFKYWGEMAWARYLNDRNLGWYLPLLQETRGVAWATIFGCGMEGGWETFDIADTHVIDGIGVLFENWVPPEEPPEPPEEDPMKVKIVDMEYNEQTEEWAKAKYSIDWERAAVAEGEPVWRLVELWEKTGDTSVITQTLDVEGNPKPNVIAAFRWKTAEQSDIAGPNDWWPNYVYGLTNENGEVGPSMGTGAYRGEGEPCIDDGPHQVWIHDDNIKTDVLKCICMLAGTFHDHLDCKFKLMTGEPPEPPGELLEVANKIYGEVKETRLLVAEIRDFLKDQKPPEPKEEFFAVEFFNNITLEGVPVYTKEEKPPFQHDWGLGSPIPGAVDEDYISARWTGDFTFEAGTYRFSVKTDDGVRLFVDGVMIINEWYPQSPHNYHADLALSAGKHEVKLEWYEQAGGATIHFRYEEL